MVVEVSGRLGHSNPAGPWLGTPSAATSSRTSGSPCYEYTWGDIVRRPRYVTTTLAER